MRGWKTWFGAALFALSQFAVTVFPEYAGTITKFVEVLGEFFVIVGVAHKIEKAGGSA